MAFRVAVFSERDRALLALLRPHLHQAYLDSEHRRRPVPQLTPGPGICICYHPGSNGPGSEKPWIDSTFA